MRLKTKRDLINTVAERWKAQYFPWKIGNFLPKEPIYNKLLKLPKGIATAKQVNKIIGNSSWTDNKCNECNGDFEVTIMLGEEPDYESSTVFVCLDCLQKAIELMKQ